MSWRDTLRVAVNPLSHTQNEHNPQKHGSTPLSADCADIAQEDKKSKLLEVLADACKGLEISPADVLEELSPEDVEGWEQGEISMGVLAAFAGALVDRRMMDEGKCPDHFMEKAHCPQCGPVYLWRSGTVLGCPWCINRAAGFPIPRPGSVRCGECCHFERVSYHPNLGHCAKGEPEAIAGLWDSDRRYCMRFIPRPAQSINKQSEAIEANVKTDFSK